MFRLTDKLGELPWQGSAGDASEPSFLIVWGPGDLGQGRSASQHAPTPPKELRNIKDCEVPKQQDPISITENLGTHEAKMGWSFAFDLSTACKIRDYTQMPEQLENLGYAHASRWHAHLLHAGNENTYVLIQRITV